MNLALVLALLLGADLDEPKTPASSVSLVQLIAQADRNDGLKVRVVGYFKVEGTGAVLYLHKEDAEQGIAANGIWLELEGAPASKVTSGWVVIEGTFSAINKGKDAQYSGSIGGISVLSGWKKK
jgi:hypothetical protein